MRVRGGPRKMALDPTANVFYARSWSRTCQSRRRMSLRAVVQDRSGNRPVLLDHSKGRRLTDATGRVRVDVEGKPGPQAGGLSRGGSSTLAA
jgi:hypothetical protein